MVILPFPFLEWVISGILLFFVGVQCYFTILISCFGNIYESTIRSQRGWEVQVH